MSVCCPHVVIHKRKNNTLLKERKLKMLDKISNLYEFMLCKQKYGENCCTIYA